MRLFIRFSAVALMAFSCMAYTGCSDSPEKPAATEKAEDGGDMEAKTEGSGDKAEMKKDAGGSDSK